MGFRIEILSAQVIEGPENSPDLVTLHTDLPKSCSGSDETTLHMAVDHGCGKSWVMEVFEIEPHVTKTDV